MRTVKGLDAGAYLALVLVLLTPGAGGAPADASPAGTWESADRHHRLVLIAREAAGWQALFYGELAGGTTGAAAFVATAERVVSDDGGLTLELPALDARVAGEHFDALAGHRSELPPTAAVGPSRWRATIEGAQLRLVCESGCSGFAQPRLALHRESR